MTGFADLVGRNQPSLGEYPAEFTAGDTWSGVVGVFRDNLGSVIDFTSGVTFDGKVIDRGTFATLATLTVTGANDGTIAWSVSSGNTATLATGYRRREACWYLKATHSSGTVAVWAALNSPLTILEK